MARPEARYGRFAKYYDFIYERLLDYGEDVRYLEAIFRKFLPQKPRTILDLGCGTGSHDLPLARRGFALTGLDLSASQLAIARRKAREAGLRIRFVRGDMRSFDLRTEFDAAICMFGAFGYLLKTADVLRSLRSIGRNLSPEGLFAFEFWQSSAVRPSPYQSWFHRKGREFELVRLSEARYDFQSKVLAVDFRFVILRGRRVLDRFDEVHRVRTYSVPEMRTVLRRGGFDLVRAFGAANGTKKGFGPVRRDTFRVFAVCRPIRR
ncbi:MAG: class I SAM-dependent methyltransferase [Methanobacteriota archaeon]|nr:MAG: class I SAM-dependent methyltransferase [Euryarchaeota archaeon]